MTQHPPAAVRRRLAGLAVAALAFSCFVAVAVAQRAPKPAVLAYELRAAAGDGPAGPATAAPGAATFAVTNPGAEPGGWQLLRVDAGTDPAEAATTVAGALDPDALEAAPVTPVAGATVAPKATGRVTVTMKAGIYLVVDTSSEERRHATVLRVEGAAGKGVRPAPAVTVTMKDFSYRFDRPVPRKGTIRFRNAGKANHIAVVFKTANAGASRKAIAALKSGDDEAAGKYIRGEGPGIEVVGAGQSADVPARYKPGAYVMVCFWGSKESQGKPHTMIGMTKAFTVR